MQDANPTISDFLPHPRKPEAAFLLYGIVHEISGQADRLDEDFLHKLIHRRLKRLERVLSAHGGHLRKSLPQGLVAGFTTAEAALVTACEMQRRCAVIPQLSDTQLALKIGIHPAVSHAPTQQAIDHAEATAAKLSGLLEDSGIILSEPAIEELPPELKIKANPIVNEGSAIAAYSVDWNTVPMRAPQPLPDDVTAHRPRLAIDTRLVLRAGARQFTLDGRHHVIAIGRDATCDVAIDNAKVSRHHARIIYRHGDYVLIDMSTNGTYIYPANGTPTRIQKNMIVLSGHGRIGFGQPWDAGMPHAFEFNIVRAA